MHLVYLVTSIGCSLHIVHDFISPLGMAIQLSCSFVTWYQSLGFPILQSRRLRQTTGDSPVRSHCRPASSSTPSSSPSPLSPDRPCTLAALRCAPAVLCAGGPSARRRPPLPAALPRAGGFSAPAALLSVPAAPQRLLRPGGPASLPCGCSPPVAASARSLAAAALPLFFPPLSLSHL